MYENEKLLSQKKKLLDDLKLIEGVTGIYTNVFFNSQTGLGGSILELSKTFREKFSNFTLDLPRFNNELHFNASLIKTAGYLSETLIDYTNSQFDHRSNDARESRQYYAKKLEVDILENAITKITLDFEKNMQSQRNKFVTEARDRKVSALKETGKLRTNLKQSSFDSQSKKQNISSQISKVEDRINTSKRRLINLNFQTKSLKESFRNRGKDLEGQLDRFENRIAAIKENPTSVDNSLINVAYVLNKKSKIIDQAIIKMRNEIVEFNDWLKN